MKNVTPLFRGTDLTRSIEVTATANAVQLVCQIQKHLGKSSRTLWREIAHSLLQLETNLGEDPWFRSQTVHWFEGISAGDPNSHPELLAPIRYDFVAKWIPDRIVIGTHADFAIPRNYMIQRLLKEVASISQAD